MKPTQDQVTAWAREAGFATSWTEAAGEALECFATLAYEAGRKDGRKWQGLTDEEIMDACSAVWASHPIEVGRVVEEKLKEKNT